MKLALRESDHTYWLDGKYMPGVSEIIRPVCNFDGIDAETLERKSEIGRAVHKLCEWHDLKRPIDRGSIDAAVKPYFEAWKRFTKEMRPKWQIVEEPMHHPTLGYAGTMDRFGTLGHDTAHEWLIDLKTVATVSPATGLQTAGYSGMLVGRMVADVAPRRAAVQLKPDGSWRLVEFSDPADWPTFLSLLTLNRWRIKHGI